MMTARSLSTEDALILVRKARLRTLMMEFVKETSSIPTETIPTLSVSSMTFGNSKLKSVRSRTANHAESIQTIARYARMA